MAFTWREMRSLGEKRGRRGEGGGEETEGEERGREERGRESQYIRPRGTHTPNSCCKVIKAGVMR